MRYVISVMMSAQSLRHLCRWLECSPFRLIPWIELNGCNDQAELPPTPPGYDQKFVCVVEKCWLAKAGRLTGTPLPGQNQAVMAQTCPLLPPPPCLFSDVAFVHLGVPL